MNDLILVEGEKPKQDKPVETIIHTMDLNDPSKPIEEKILNEESNGNS